MGGRVTPVNRDEPCSMNGGSDTFKTIQTCTLILLGLGFGSSILAHDGGTQPAGAGTAAVGPELGELLTPEEKQWVAEHPVIRFAPDRSWRPIDFLTSEGQHAGIAADYLQLIAQRLGIRFVSSGPARRHEAIEKMTANQIDLIASCVITDDRKQSMLFTPAYLDLRNVIIVPNTGPARIALKDLKGLRVAVVTGHAVRNHIAAEVPEAQIRRVPDFRAGIRQVSFGHVDALIGDIAAVTFQIQKDGITNLRIAGNVGFNYHVGIASRQDWPELNRVLTKALATVTPEERQAIYSKWIRLDEAGSPFPGPEFWLWSGVALLAVLAMLGGIIAWNRTLKREVRIRTEQLSNELAERQRAEQERRRLEEDLRQAQKMDVLGTLAAGIAHDFNNLLTIMMGFTAVARAQLPPDHPAQEPLITSETAIKDASGITRSLLTLSRKSAPVKTPVNLRRVVDESVRLLRRVMPNSIQVERAQSSDEPLVINADEGQLHQVLMNVITNARDAMPQGGRICVSTCSAEGGEGSSDERCEWAVLEVSDNGPGMPLEVLEHAFDPFFTTKPKGQGTGLGLAMVQAIINEHGGTIRIDSRSGEGTRVIIRLPVCGHGTEEVPHLPEKAGQQPRKPYSVLLAEDSPQVRTIFARALERSGYSVVEVGGGDEAMTLLSTRTQSFDVAILDYDLPEVDGLEIARRIHSQSPAFPILIVSGNPDLDMTETEHFRRLCKPFATSELVSLIPQLIEAGRTQASSPRA